VAQRSADGSADVPEAALGKGLVVTTRLLLLLAAVFLILLYEFLALMLDE
jgi:hypothetical protein